MTTYRLKPATVDARQVTKDNSADLIEWGQGDIDLRVCAVYGPSLYVTTAQDEERADPGDWIVIAGDGMMGVFSDDDFKRNFEPVS